MPTQIYSASNNWIKQAEEQIETYPSGMIKTTQVYIYPGITSTLPSELQNAYPAPVLEYTTEGFTRAVGYLYSIKIVGGEMIDQGNGTSAGSGQYVSPKIINSKIVKTGTATKNTTKKVDVKQGDNLVQINKTFTEIFNFEYLTDQISTEGARIGMPLTPSSPSGTPTIIVVSSPPGFSSGNLYGQSWALSSYSSQNYGEVYETKFIYEGSAKMFQFIDLTGEGLPTPPAP